MALTTACVAQDLVLNFAPAETKVSYALSATAHTVHGTFSLRRGVIHYNRESGQVSGEVIIDAASGNSGNDGRDRKMHRDILESTQFPDIIFQPDRVEGKVAAEGSSTIQVHGMFTLHGVAHEVTLPVEVKLDGSRWTASTKFKVPYIDWGLKNPSTFILRVSREVEIQAEASGAR
jgi:polyisoprenoid-binding protein YceI